jgi:hypothetical protein
MKEPKRKISLLMPSLLQRKGEPASRNPLVDRRSIKQRKKVCVCVIHSGNSDAQTKPDNKQNMFIILCWIRSENYTEDIYANQETKTQDVGPPSLLINTKGNTSIFKMSGIIRKKDTQFTNNR